MATKIIQAVAGAGKTFYITHKLGKNQRSLYITYTNGNVRNLRNELRETDKDCGMYMVRTFSKFVIDWFIRPFYPLLVPNCGTFKGFTTVEPVNNSRLPNYVKKSDRRHYVDKNNNLYLSRLSELVLNQGKDFFTKAFQRIGKYVDVIFIDEYQDFTGKDFDLIKKMLKQKFFDIVLAGDVFQAGVVNSQSKGRGLKKISTYKLGQEIKSFLNKILEVPKNTEIDTTSLLKSQRISIECASFVHKYLKIPIESVGKTKGKVFYINDLERLKQLDFEEIDTILVYDRRTCHSIQNKRYTSWTYSKGDTYDNVLLVLTNTSSFIANKDITEDELNSYLKKMSTVTRNRLYVALTRSQGNLYVVNSEAWKELNKVKNNI